MSPRFGVWLGQPLVLPRGAFAVVCFALALGALTQLEVIADPTAAESQARHVTGATPTSPPSRTFVLMVDSFRHETARDAELMPHLADLRTRSTHARVTTVVDAITVPALRAAFTGVERLSVLGFISNLFHGDSSVASLFAELDAAGRKAVVHSDGSFDQFGRQNMIRHAMGSAGPRELAEQTTAARAALRDFLEHERPFVVAHLTVSDHVAHWCGVGCNDYRRVFRTIDDLIAELDASIPADCTLLVMGDHGHDAEGRHVMGQDVPTVATYRSPALRQGLDLGTIHITAHRYFLGWVTALGMGEYEGKRYPSALVSVEPLARVWSDEIPPRPPPPVFDRSLVAAYVGMVMALLLLPLRGRGQLLAAALALVPLALPQLHPYPLVFGLLAVAAVGARARLPLGNIALWALASLALFAWGHVLGTFRPPVQDPRSATLALLWCAWFAAIAAATLRWGGLAGAAVAFVPLFLSFPSIWKYGAMQAVSGTWLGTVFAYGLARWRVQRMSALELVNHALLVLILLPNFFYHVQNFEAQNTIPMRYLPAESGTWLDAVALLIIVVRRNTDLATALGAAALASLLVLEPQLGLSHAAVVNTGMVIVYLHCLLTWQRRADANEAWSASVLMALMLGNIAIKQGSPTSYQLVLAVGASLGVYLGLMRGYLAPRFNSPLALMAGMLLFRACIVTPPQAQHWIDYTVAAMVVSARVARNIPNETDRSHFVAALYLVGLGSIGWSVFGWTTTWLEWGVVYECVTERVVERYISVFFPLILLRYAIPLWLLHRSLDVGAIVWPTIARLVAIRMWVFLCVTCALVSYDFSAYLDSLSQLLLFAVCGLGSLAIPRPVQWGEPGEPARPASVRPQPQLSTERAA